VLGCGCRSMRNQESSLCPEHGELLGNEVADIVATANGQGFAAKDILSELADAVAEAMRALAEAADTPPGTRVQVGTNGRRIVKRSTPEA
jgi:hypothetical protein